MTDSVRAIVFNAQADYATSLRQSLMSIPELKVAAEIDQPDHLAPAVAQFSPDAVIAHLDPQPLVVLDALEALVQAHPHLPVIAVSGHTEGDVLLRAMRVGLRRFLVKPLTTDELRTVLEQVQRDRPKGPKRGRLISVMGSAGGVGATFVATNLACELADLTQGDRRVALLDCDFRFGQVATVLDLDTPFTVADLCATPEQIDPAMVDRALVRHAMGVHVLARPHHFHQAENITAAHCANVLSMLLEMFPYVVVDGPMRNDPDGRVLLDAADFNLMVIQLLVTSVRNTDRMSQELVAQGFNTQRMQLVCNRVGRESAYLEIERVESTLGNRIFQALPDDWRSVSSAINVGQPLRNHAPRSKIRCALRELAMRIHAPEKVAAPARHGRLLERLLGKQARTRRAGGADPPRQGGRPAGETGRIPAATDVPASAAV